ncbi:hypothetical protein ACFE33_02670 [Falsihalocynthiibacter sp. SS001]|uniref:hypothetical protein n=1 Tax=Falsihalocynthiibacter sp. SS001 TaxID=3349698 RepID=UPI0036D3B26A
MKFLFALSLIMAVFFAHTLPMQSRESVAMDAPHHEVACCEAGEVMHAPSCALCVVANQEGRVAFERSHKRFVFVAQDWGAVEYRHAPPQGPPRQL